MTVRRTRIAGAVLGTVLLAGCGSTGAPGTSTPAVEGSSSTTTGETASTAAPEGSEAAMTTEGARTERGEVEGGDLGYLDGGDESADRWVPLTLQLPQGWTRLDPDGPHFRTEVCGVQLDPQKPRDAVQRRWAFQDSQALEVEVHLFETAERGLVDEVASAVADCQGYGVTGDGDEVSLGAGEYNVEVSAQPHHGGWVRWTETTRETGMVRHIALQELEDGWRWVSHVDLAGESDQGLRDDVTDQLGESGN